MRRKRIMFIISLIVLFCGCFMIMNRHYDRLARYQYASDDNREIILKYLNTDDINFMISQQLKPEQFLPFIDVKGFDIHNTIWYATAKQERDAPAQIIVSFINECKSRLQIDTLSSLLKAYDYNTLFTFFHEDNEYVKNASITQNPMDPLVTIGKKETLFTYHPNHLQPLKSEHGVVVKKGNQVSINQEVVKPLQEMCQALQSTFDKPCGDMQVVHGFLSYEEQIPIYERMIVTYGRESFSQYGDLPGQSEFQLGNSVLLQMQDIDEVKLQEYLKQKKERGKEESLKDSSKELNEEEKKKKALQDRMEWMEGNAYKYGFIVRYPKDTMKITGKEYQPFILRYVGKEVAKQLFEQNQTLEQYQKK